LAERAAQLADRGFDNILKGLKPGMTEFEALALLELPMKHGGYWDQLVRVVTIGVLTKQQTN
jgi:Xaa-Pro aminopeptidase